jgi:hypothetical protein
VHKTPARRVPLIISRPVIDAAAPLDGDDEGCDEVVGDGVLPCVEDPVGDGEAEDPPLLSMPERVLSEANWADTPEELVQEDGGVPCPATKFTGMH